MSFITLGNPSNHEALVSHVVAPTETQQRRIEVTAERIKELADHVQYLDTVLRRGAIAAAPESRAITSPGYFGGINVGLEMPHDLHLTVIPRNLKRLPIAKEGGARKVESHRSWFTVAFPFEGPTRVGAETINDRNGMVSGMRFVLSRQDLPKFPEQYAQPTTVSRFAGSRLANVEFRLTEIEDPGMVTQTY